MIYQSTQESTKSFSHGRALLLHLSLYLAGNTSATTLPFVVPWSHGIIPIRNSHPNAGPDLWAAVREVEAKTPVRFLNRTVEQDFVDVVLGDDDVVKNDAWQYNTSDVIGFCAGTSELFLKDGNGWLALHELGHVLGLVHEHQRVDRDEFVEVLWGNVSDPEPGNVNWVRLDDSDTQGLPYDPNSVMHYGSDWQAEAGTRTMEWLDNSAATGDCIHYDCLPVVGWSELTTNDAHAISAMYSTD